MPDNVCRWKLRLDIRHVCDEPALPDDCYCILHSENDDKDLDAFTNKVTDRIEEVTEEINLRGCYFPKKFPHDYFRERNFDKPVYLAEATFSGMTSFFGTKFLQKAIFSGATFSQNTNFSRATFQKKSCFSRAEFSVVDFSGTTFKEGVSFFRAEFKIRASFLPHSKGKKVFFGYPSSFQNTRFLGEAIFQHVDLSQCSFLHSNIDKVDFRYCTFAEKGFRQNILKDELDCDKRVSQYETKHYVYSRLKQIYKDRNTHDWYGIVRQLYLGLNLELTRSLKYRKKTREGYKPVRRLYLELKRNFEEKKDWNKAGDFHFGEMECRRKMKGWWGRKFSLTAFYCWSSGYCERPLRTFIWLLAFVLGLFPLVYRFSEGKPFFAVTTYVWDSVNVATLKRLGDLIELHTWWGNCLLVVEFILSPLLITLLALALRRKVKR